MKKFIAMLLAITMCISITACGGSSSSVTNPILEAENRSAAYEQFEILWENAETEEEKEELESCMSEYFFNDITGFYFFNNPERRLMHVESDNRAIYVKSKDEIYIVPYSEEELKDMGISLETIPEIENSELYKYHLVDLKAKSQKGLEYFMTEATLKSDYIEGDDLTPFNSIEIFCFYSDIWDNSCHINGYFADEQELILDNFTPYGREYFKDKHASYANKAKRDKQDENYGKPVEKEKPAIGMTKDEVLGSTWGSPDKKNIDEYTWGTEEQWVYEDQGYIYFENDEVTSIQHRE